MTLITFFGWSLACFCATASLVLWAQSRRRMVMLARAAHELRGPLCAARLALSPTRAAEWERRIAAVDFELFRAGRALDDLSEAARGRNLGSKVRRFDLRSLLIEATEAWRPLADSFGAELRLDLPDHPVFVGADSVQIAQAVRNLVGNACEHGGGGRVEVVLRSTLTGVRVVVSDRGPGLPMSIEGLIAKERRNTSRRGHGLVVVAETAARHGGGFCEERSQTGPGASLVLTLPHNVPLSTPSTGWFSRSTSSIRGTA